MVLRPPFDHCPDCNYPLVGLPMPGRCPECGFAYDLETRVWRPRKRMGLFFGYLAIEVGLLCLLLGPVATLFEVIAGPRVGHWLVLMVILILLAGSFIVLPMLIWRKRFVALTPAGVIVRNLGAPASVRFDDISMVGTRDGKPWVKGRGDDRLISLHGLFDTVHELAQFEVALDRRRRGVPVEVPEAIAVSSQAAVPLARRARRRLDRVTRCGVAVIAMGIMLLITGGVWGERGTWLVNVGVAGFWLGAIIALVGQWRGDAPKKNGE